MPATSWFNRIEECDILLSKLASENHPHMQAFYEWIKKMEHTHLEQEDLHKNNNY